MSKMHEDRHIDDAATYGQTEGTLSHKDLPAATIGQTDTAMGH